MRLLDLYNKYSSRFNWLSDFLMQVYPESVDLDLGKLVPISEHNGIYSSGNDLVLLDADSKEVLKLGTFKSVKHRDALAYGIYTYSTDKSYLLPYSNERVNSRELTLSLGSGYKFILHGSTTSVKLNSFDNKFLTEFVKSVSGGTTYRSTNSSYVLGNTSIIRRYFKPTFLDSTFESKFNTDFKVSTLNISKEYKTLSRLGVQLYKGNGYSPLKVTKTRITAGPFVKKLLLAVREIQGASPLAKLLHEYVAFSFSYLTQNRSIADPRIDKELDDFKRILFVDPNFAKFITGRLKSLVSIAQKKGKENILAMSLFYPIVSTLQNLPYVSRMTNYTEPVNFNAMMLNTEKLDLYLSDYYRDIISKGSEKFPYVGDAPDIRSSIRLLKVLNARYDDWIKNS